MSQGADREVSIGRHADRQALRALLPHERVEFVAAETYELTRDEHSS